MGRVKEGRRREGGRREGGSEGGRDGSREEGRVEGENTCRTTCTSPLEMCYLNPIYSIHVYHTTFHCLIHVHVHVHDTITWMIVHLYMLYRYWLPPARQGYWRN